MRLQRSALRRTGNQPSSLTNNANNGGVDNVDKVTGTYSCKRRTARWPLAIFHNIIDISTFNASELNPIPSEQEELEGGSFWRSLERPL